MKISLGTGTRFTRHRPPGWVKVPTFALAVAMAVAVVVAASAAATSARSNGHKENIVGLAGWLSL